MIEGVETKIERTNRRKTIGLEIHPGPVLRVLAPSSLSEDQIERALQSKSSWIYQKLNNSRVKENPRKKEMVSGESLPFKGQDYRLKVLAGVLAPVTLKDSYIIVSVPKSVRDEDKDDFIRSSLIEWYKVQAKELLPTIVDRMAKKVGVEPKTVTIKDYKSSWGRCTPDGDIFLNWQLITLKNKLIDYVICHELCHLVFNDHSAEFWSFLIEFYSYPKNLESELNDTFMKNGSVVLLTRDKE